MSTTTVPTKPRDIASHRRFTEDSSQMFADLVVELTPRFGPDDAKDEAARLWHDAQLAHDGRLS